MVIDCFHRKCTFNIHETLSPPTYSDFLSVKGRIFLLQLRVASAGNSMNMQRVPGGNTSLSRNFSSFYLPTFIPIFYLFIHLINQLLNQLKILLLAPMRRSGRTCESDRSIDRLMFFENFDMPP